MDGAQAGNQAEPESDTVTQETQDPEANPMLAHRALPLEMMRQESAEVLALLRIRVPEEVRGSLVAAQRESQAAERGLATAREALELHRQTRPERGELATWISRERELLQAVADGEEFAAVCQQLEESAHADVNAAMVEAWRQMVVEARTALYQIEAEEEAKVRAAEQLLKGVRQRAYQRINEAQEMVERLIRHEPGPTIV